MTKSQSKHVVGGKASALRADGDTTFKITLRKRWRLWCNAWLVPHQRCNKADLSTPRSDVIAVFASFSGQGGVERMLIHFMQGCHAVGQPIDLILTRSDSHYLVNRPAQSRLIDLGSRHTLLAVPALARYLRSVQPRSLLVAKERAGRAALLARWLAGTRTPIVLRLGTHVSTAMAERSVFNRWLRSTLIRWQYPAFDAIIAVSQGVADDIAHLAPVPVSRIHVIRNPVITAACFHLAQAPCPHPWLQPDQPPVIIGIGRLQRQKDFLTLLHAFSQIRQRGYSYRLLILGEGRGRHDLERCIQQLKLQQWVRLVGFQANPYAFLSRAKLFVLSSLWEGSPNALTEAMALGVPVVATDCPSGPAELLANGQFGPLVPVGDSQALAQAMFAVLAAPPPAAQLQAAVRDYHVRASTAQYLTVLTTV
jgi:glycosyltransferase involved in cell wall biosynthesis